MIFIENNRGQISIEFMFYILAVIFAISTYIFFFSLNTSNQSYLEESNINNEIYNLKSVIEYVHSQGDGFFINYSLPEKINNKNYTITIIDNDLYLQIENETYIESLLINEIVGNFSAGGVYLLQNKEGVVYVERVG